MIQTMGTTDPYLTMRHLRERGWTERLVRRFLGNPDDRLPNTHINGGSPQRLFLASRVEQIERDDQGFIAEKIRSQEYSLSLQGARDSKRQSLDALVRGIPLPCLSIAIDDVLAQAAATKKTHSGYQFQPVEQVALTILLDTMKSLGCQLDLYMWHPGVRDARILLIRRMLAHIIDHYPQLAEAALYRASQENGSADSW